MAEFFNDEQRRAHLEALENEKEGYKALLERVNLDDDGPSPKRIEKTIEEIDAEIDRISGNVSVEEDVDDDGSDGGKKKKADKGAKANG
jgi:hypothetical protein